ncbi:MAG: pilus assembly protein [Parvularculaceae bacterium]
MTQTISELRLRQQRRRRSLLRDTCGMAAVEFALILPSMVLLFFGMLEASNLLVINRRMATAANSLVDLAAQEASITNAELDDIIVGVKRILEPSPTEPLTIKVISVEKGPNNNDPIVVHWSRDEDGATPYSAGSVYTGLDDDTVLQNGRSILVVDIEYDYSAGVTGHVFQLPFHFEEKAKRWPRISDKVQLCATAAPSSCTS